MNNKGFAISSMLYGLIIVILLVFVTLMSIMSYNRTKTVETVNDLRVELESK